MTFSTSPRFDFRFATGLVSRTTSVIVSGTAFVSRAIELNWRWKKPPKMVINGALHPSSIDNLKTGTLLGFHCDEGRKVMFYLMMHSTHFILKLYGVGSL